MAFLADHDDGAHRLRGGVQLPHHLERRGKGRQLRVQRFVCQPVAGKLHSHEEEPGVMVVVLRSFFDVAAALQQKTRDGVDDAFAVRARQG